MNRDVIISIALVLRSSISVYQIRKSLYFHGWNVSQNTFHPSRNPSAEYPMARNGTASSIVIYARMKHDQGRVSRNFHPWIRVHTGGVGARTSMVLSLRRKAFSSLPRRGDDNVTCIIKVTVTAIVCLGN